MGSLVGASVVGAFVGAFVGASVVGAAVGSSVVGAGVGSSVVGAGVGASVVGAGVGASVVGSAVGSSVVGECVGDCVVGADVGAGQFSVLVVKPPPPEVHPVHVSKEPCVTMVPLASAVAAVRSTQYVPDPIRFGFALSTNVGWRQLLIAGHE